MTKTLYDLFGQWLAQRAVIAETNCPTDAELDNECDKLRRIECAILSFPAATASDVWVKVLLVVDSPSDGLEQSLRRQACKALQVAGRHGRVCAQIWPSDEEGVAAQ